MNASSYGAHSLMLRVSLVHYMQLRSERSTAGVALRHYRRLRDCRACLPQRFDRLVMPAAIRFASLHGCSVGDGSSGRLGIAVTAGDLA
jgi:hypothetical protein